MIDENFTLESLVDDWLRTYTNQDKSPATVRTYRTLLRGLLRWFEATHGEEMRCAHLGSRNGGGVSTIDRYLLARKGDGMAASSTRTFVAAIRQFSGWLHASGYTAGDGARGSKGYRVPKRQIDILTDAEIAGVEDYLRGGPDPYDDLLLFRLLLGTGLRRAEAAGLLVRDALLIDGRGQPVHKGQLTVVGKGNKQRTVGCGLWLTAELRRYLREARPKRLHPDEPAPEELLLNRHGYPLTPDTITRRFARWAAALDLPKLHPHTCRHTFATGYIVAGGDVAELMVLLGHTTVQQTMHYVQLAGTLHAVRRAQTLCPIDARLAAERVSRDRRKPDARLTGQRPEIRVLDGTNRAQSRRARRVG